MKERALFDAGPRDGNLTDKQQTVLTILQNAPFGLRAINVGHVLHQVRGCPVCNPDRTCQYATPDATAVLQSLGTQTEANPRGRGLVIRRQTGRWELLHPPARERDTGTLPPDF